MPIRSSVTVWTNLPRVALALTVAALTGACASSGAVPRPFPTTGGAAAGIPNGTAEPSATVHSAVVGTALALRGVPYRNGGADLGGFDCSGFTQYVYAQYGVALPREVRDQYQQGVPVDAMDVVPGDLLFFTTIAPGPTHVAIAIGGDRFVHAPSSTGVVRVESLTAAYWSARYLGARRPGLQSEL
jgi:cell wall-associated NlpC family hydrolase